MVTFWFIFTAVWCFAAGALVAIIQDWPERLFETLPWRKDDKLLIRAEATAEGYRERAKVRLIFTLEEEDRTRTRTLFLEPEVAEQLAGQLKP